MSDLTNRICVKCQRVIDLSDLSINDGKPYHDYCLLQNTRSRIAFLSDKIGRRTATVLDGEELADLLFIEERMKSDIETQKKYHISNDTHVFFGNTPLGKHSAMNSPKWKQILAKRRSLEGTKYRMHKTPNSPPQTTEPNWQITTDENGHKGVIQIGTRPIQPPLETKKEELPAGQISNLTIQTRDKIDYDVERVNINIWRGFELLDKLIPDSNLLELNGRVAALNRERKLQSNIMVLA